MDSQPSPLSLLVIVLEARALFLGRSELLETVRQLDSLAVQLKAKCRARVVGIQAGEGGLARWIIVDERERVAPQPGANDGAHEQLEKLIAPGSLREADGVGRGGQLLQRGCEWVHTQLAKECVA